MWKVNETLLRSIVTPPHERNYLFAENFTTLDRVAQEMLYDKMCNKPVTATVQPSPVFRMQSSDISEGSFNATVKISKSLGSIGTLLVQFDQRSSVANFIVVLHRCVWAFWCSVEGMMQTELLVQWTNAIIRNNCTWGYYYDFNSYSGLHLSLLILGETSRLETNYRLCSCKMLYFYPVGENTKNPRRVHVYCLA